MLCLPQGHSAFARPMAGVLRTLRPLRTCCSRWSPATSLHLPAAVIAPHCRVTVRNFAIPSASAAHPPAAARKMPAVRDTIEPTELEQRIFKTLKAAAADGGTPVTLRCAGGWVRDKLLGLDTDSPDIDVALDTLTGAAFGQALQRHLQESHDEVARAVVIESNPEQSKHLETARIRVRLCLLFVVASSIRCLMCLDYAGASAWRQSQRPAPAWRIWQHPLQHLHLKSGEKYT
jgi:Poly A polymerase head domain